VHISIHILKFHVWKQLFNLDAASFWMNLFREPVRKSSANGYYDTSIEFSQVIKLKWQTFAL